MKITETFGKNLYSIFKIILLIVCTISIVKIAFCGIKITSLKKGFIDIQLDERSKVKIIDNDFENPIWVHVETTGEYNTRLNNSIKRSEHEWKMKNDENYRNEWNKDYEEWKEKRNIK
ncbi:hypothetical protein IJI31_01370 [bacterium]|nr:hypothetical protein [bacterium]